jgi:XTP/dITP diphosphohydrolase
MNPQELRYSIAPLQEVLEELREKCPWDKKQTIHTLRQLTIEECYELADAITKEDWKEIKEELGDVLLHILFYSKIASEQQQFNIDDVVEGIKQKLIARHPHIYGDVKVENEDDVKRNWENLKLKEGKTSVLSGVPRSLPPMVQAMRLQEKAKQVGFEWEKNRVEEEIGDLFFSLINYARFLQIDPEQALSKTNHKFMSRFQQMEKIVNSQGKKMTDLKLDELDQIWDEVKKS